MLDVEDQCLGSIEPQADVREALFQPSNDCHRVAARGNEQTVVVDPARKAYVEQGVSPMEYEVCDQAGICISGRNCWQLHLRHAVDELEKAGQLAGRHGRSERALDLLVLQRWKEPFNVSEDHEPCRLDVFIEQFAKLAVLA